MAAQGDVGPLAEAVRWWTGTMDRFGRPQPPLTGVQNAEVLGEAGFIADAIVLRS
jgi:hypothetical protein